MLQAIKDIHAVAVFMRFLVQVFAGLVWFYENIVRPVARTLIWRPLKWVVTKYRLLWDRVVYLKTGHFSYPRAGMMVTATVAAIYLLVPVVQFVLDGMLFLVTSKHETVYLTQSQEIYPDDDIHSVKGCDSLPCTDESAIYFRVRPHYFHQFWSMVKGKGLFYPDYVAAAVPPGISKCEVTSYGMRLKFLMRQFNVYPDLLEARCEQNVPPQR